MGEKQGDSDYHLQGHMSITRKLRGSSILASIDNIELDKTSGGLRKEQ